ncbi:MAG: superfamily I DNA and/or RNA helicase [Cyclobacteriaceae bacterium]|jgi:superfamily I DNA and/or RNA helicase
MEKILQSYLRRLTNLSSNNRSLLFLRLISDQSIDLHEFDHALDNPSFNIIEKLIAKKVKIPLLNEIDTHDSAGNKTSQKLKKIDRIEKFIFQERGSRDLYVGWPFIRGKFADDTLVSAPLIFFPVHLELNESTWYLKQREDVNITFNKTFLLAYSYYNKISVDEELVEKTLTDMDEDAMIFRTMVYQILKESQLEINFNQDNFLDKLSPFKNYKKSELDNIEKTGTLKLYPEAVLGIFPQAGSYLVPDYVKLLEQKDVKDISAFFTERKKTDPEDEGKTKFSDKVKEETTFTPFACDASQERAIQLIKKGNSMVVQGPPGTGKSQLISNLICDYIARGKKVLLICQKKAALDVVYNRLKSKEMHDFVGLVHDFKNDRKSIFEQIASQIDNVDQYKQKNNGLDAIYLERTFLQSSRKIDQAVEELDEFKKALYDESECGKSVKELYLISNPELKSITLNQEYRQFHFERMPKFTLLLKQYLDYHERFEKLPDFWIGRPDYTNFSSLELARLKEVIDETDSFQEQLKKESSAFLKAPMDYETCLHFLTHKESIQQLIVNLDNELVFKYYQLMQANQTERPPWLTNLEKTTLQCFKGAGVEKSVDSKDLGRFQEALESAIKARKGFFRWLKWTIFSKEKIFVTRVLVANNLKSNREGFEVLLARIDNRLNFEHILTEIQKTNWLADFPNGFRMIDIQNWFFYQKLAFKSNDISNTIRTLVEFAPDKDHTRESYINMLVELNQLLEKVPTQIQLWSRYLNEKQIRSLMLERENIDDLKKQLNKDFDAFVEYDKIRESMTADERKIISNLLNLESEDESDILQIFSNSVALAWIDHIEAKYPILRAVSSLRLDHLIRELQEAIVDKMQISREILLLKSREKTYKDLEYNRLNNLVTYRDLYHQVTKKRKVWPIRRVISQHSEELFAILPCWMASPESASAIFPMEEHFDLVIFDEASQCFAERGIPGMYRGKQVVIAGDDKQLQPNDLYRVRWEDDDDSDIPELEIDSLLNLAKQYLPEVSLQGHYRSRSLELIAFSNNHFYNGKLKLLPDFNSMQNMSPSIHYIKTDGIWEDNINHAEAEKTVQLVVRLLKEMPKKEIGVVTFNAKQQSYVQDLLDIEIEKHGLSIPDSFFVKNIENVQGDEKDIIIFTTAYAKDKNGKLFLKFGSLNVAGGENRLNVAITRAREEIYVITSLMPSELKTEDLKNPGPKLLKSYLDFALQVSEGKWKPEGSANSKQGLDWYLKHKIRAKSPLAEINQELPFADLTVKVNGQYSGLILTDDDLFFETLSSKEAYNYRFEHFQEKHWPYVQFYSREYWIDQQQAQEKLEKFLYRTTH